MNLRELLAPVWRQQWRWLALGIVLMFTSAVAALALLGLSGWLITASALAGAGLIAAIDIFTPGGGIRLAAITRTLSRYAERLATHRATLGLLASLRTRLFEQLLRLDEIQLRQLQRGDTLERLTRDVGLLEHQFAGVVGPVITAVMTSLCVSVVLVLLVSPQTALVAVGFTLACLGIAILAESRGRGRAGELARGEPELRRLCTESLEGLKSLLAEGRSEDRRRHIETLSGWLISRRKALARLDVLGQSAVSLAGYGATWAVLFLALPQAPSAPLAIVAVLVVLGSMEVWLALPAAWRQLTRSRFAARRVTALAGRDPVLSAPTRPRPMPRSKRLALERVDFAWPNSSRPVLQQLSLQVEQGERIALCGPSGSGKTTLALLMMRQIDPDAGVVRLGGQDLRELDPAELRRCIGYLPQQPVVFHDTLAANLRVASPDSGDAALIRALHRAGLGQLLSGLENGLEQFLDERGGNISGGEQRRLGLARLMLADPPVVILDEPTTGLDQLSSLRLAERLDAWLHGRTVVMISHEPERLPPYDRAFFL